MDIKYDKKYIFSEFWASNPNYEEKKKNLKCFFNHFIFISFLLSFFPSWRLSLLPKLYFNTLLLITHDFCSPLTLNTSINILIGGNEALTAQRAWCSSEHEVYLWCCRAAQRRVHTTDMKWNLLFFSFYIQLSSHRSVCTKLVSQLKVHFVCRTCTSTALADIPKKKKNLSIETGSILTRYAGGGMFDTNRRLVTRWSSTDVQERRRQ